MLSSNVANSATFNTSKSVWPSTSKFAFASIFPPNVDTPVTDSVLVVVPPEICTLPITSKLTDGALLPIPTLDIL